MARARGARGLIYALVLCALVTQTACGNEPRGVHSGAMPSGRLQLDLVLPKRATGDVDYEISSDKVQPFVGVMLKLPGTDRAVAVVELPVGSGYFLAVHTVLTGGVPCRTAMTFDIDAERTTSIDLRLPCDDSLASDASNSEVWTGRDAQAATPDGTVEAGSGSSDTDRDTADASQPGVAAPSPLNPQAPHDGGIPPTKGPEPAVDAGHAPVRDAGAAPQLPATSTDAGHGSEDAGQHGGDDAGSGSGERDAGPASPPPESEVETCERCSERECAQFHGVQRGRDCYTASGSLSDGPAQGQARAEVCASLIACAYRVSCVSYNELECYCGYGVDLRSCQAQPQGPCRREYEAAGQTTEPRQILGKIFALDDEDEDSDEVIEEGGASLLEVASRLVACQAERCMTMCSD